MKNNKKTWIILAAAAALLLLAAVTFRPRHSNVAVGDLPISRLYADFAVNTDEPREIVGSADYYFVAMVNEVVGTEYRNPVTVETANGFREVADPYTNYTITVVKNIKGALETDTPISITKSGGVSSDGSSLVLYEDDALLEQGKYYVIAAHAQPDGSLLIAGPHSSELLTVGNRSVAVTESDYSQYEIFYTEEVARERVRFVSEYDLSQGFDSAD
jgi:hypothetical protein